MKTLSNTELMRSMWLVELRRQGHRKCEETWMYTKTNKVCALGLLREIAITSTKYKPEDFFDGKSIISIAKVGKAAGLSREQSLKVAYMNDGWPVVTKYSEPNKPQCYRKYSFAEIADVVEGWFNDRSKSSK